MSLFTMIFYAYQNFKLVIIEIFDLSRDAIHIHVGFMALLIWLVVFKKRLDRWTSLLPPFLLSLAMEIMDLLGDHLHRQQTHFLASAHDLLNTNFVPVMLVIWAKLDSKRKAHDQNY